MCSASINLYGEKQTALLFIVCGYEAAGPRNSSHVLPLHHICPNKASKIKKKPEANQKSWDIIDFATYLFRIEKCTFVHQLSCTGKLRPNTFAIFFLIGKRKSK